MWFWWEFRFLDHLEFYYLFYFVQLNFIFDQTESCYFIRLLFSQGLAVKMTEIAEYLQTAKIKWLSYLQFCKLKWYYSLFSNQKWFFIFCIKYWHCVRMSNCRCMLYIYWFPIDLFYTSTLQLDSCVGLHNVPLKY